MNATTLPFGPGCPWYSMLEKWGPANVKWCEGTICSIINEPANTWSNVAYLLGALYLYSIGMRRYSVAVAVLGATSFAYHATNNFMTQIFDFMGMFAWGFLLLTWNARRLGWIPHRARHAAYLGMNAVWIALLFLCRAVDVPYQILVPLIGLAVIATEVALRKVDEGVTKDYRPLRWTLGMIGLAFAFSAADHGRFMCDPSNHWIQGHAIWHVASAIGITVSGLFYRQIPLCRG